MNEPTGYTALDLIGYTDKGDYSAVATYVKNDLVNYGGSKWRCKIDDTTAVTPTEGVNWTVFVAIPADTTKQIIAPVEDATSLHAYAVGEQLIYNDTLYTVTAAISIGDALVVGTNITASDTVIEQVEDINGDIAEVEDEINAISNVYGSKNLCPIESRTISGLTFAPDKNGYMTCSSNEDIRAWGYTVANQFITLKAGTYFVKAFAKTAGTTGYYGIRLFDSANNSIFIGDWNEVLSNGQTFTLSADTDIGVVYKIGNGSYAFLIMDNRIKDRTYALYAKTNRELTDDIMTALFSNPVALTSANDLNSITTPGLYMIAGSAPSNAPSGMGNTYSSMMVFRGGLDTAITQVYIGGGWRSENKHIAIRGYGGTPAAWSAWRYITDATS